MAFLQVGRTLDTVISTEGTAGKTETSPKQEYSRLEREQSRDAEEQCDGRHVPIKYT